MASLTLAAPLPGTTQLSSIGDWEKFFLPLRGDGVLSGLDPSLDASGRNIVMAAGSAFVRAFIGYSSGSNSTSIATNGSGQNRKDRLVLRLDRSAGTAANLLKPVVIQGTPAASPQAPAITRTTSGLWDLPIAQWTSGSNGSLSGLVDERQLLGGQVTYSTNETPYPPTGPGVLITPSKVMASINGTSWDTVLWADTGWVALTTNGPDGGAWSTDGTCRIRMIGKEVHIRFVIQRKGTSALGVNDANGSSPITIPAQYRPSDTSEIGSAFTNFFAAPRIAAACQVNPDGTIQVFAIDQDLPVNRTMGGSFHYFVA